MDVDDLLKFQPQMIITPVAMPMDVKRSSAPNPRKRSRLDFASRLYAGPIPPVGEAIIPHAPKVPKLHIINKPVQIEIPQEKPSYVENALKELEKSNLDEDPMDVTKVKKMVLNFDKKVLRNQELRIKFPEEPHKFMESEIELNETIEEMHSLATVPDLYPLLVELGAIRTILNLLSHDNTDIGTAAIDLLKEMTDSESIEESDGTDDIIEALLSGDIITMLVFNLNRLDESQRRESDGVYNILALIENMAELYPDVCNEAVNGGLINWCNKRLKSKGHFDGNKLYTSEILAICIQNNQANQKAVGAMEGIDVLLQQLAQYKRHDPPSSEEQEMMENLFDILCSCLLCESNRDPFLNGEGLQLMNLMLREKKLSRNGALRVLNHALSGKEGIENCNKFVDILGLRTLFPLFMKTPMKHGKKGLAKSQHEEHVVSIISWLLKNCRLNQKQRLINKFTENDHEKVDRLLELHFKYLEKVIKTNTALEEQSKSEDISEDDMYLKRLDGGLFTLQIVDYIMLYICASGPPSIKKRVLKILNVRNASIKTIKNIIREYAGNIGDDAESTEKSEEQQSILELLDKFQNS